jgi:hypothetical protein
MSHAQVPDIAAAAVKPKPAAAPPPESPKPAEPKVSMAELEAERDRDIKRAADQARAVNRLNEYAAVGLEDSPRNAELIKNFVENSPAKGYWSYEVVEVAIKTLGNKLTWRKVEAPSAPAPSPAVEVTRTVAVKTRCDGSRDEEGRCKSIEGFARPQESSNRPNSDRPGCSNKQASKYF